MHRPPHSVFATTTLAFATAVLLAGTPVLAAAPAAARGDVATTLPRHRLFVLTDIQGDPDDTQSLVRLLLYSNEIDLAGIAAVTSAPQPDRIAPAALHAVIDEYAKVRRNLLRHAPGYPPAARLHAIVHAGVPRYGLRGVGPGQDSPASGALIKALQDPDPRPLWVAAWGGVNALAQALATLEATEPPERAASLRRKLRVYTISDQDDSGPWIRKRYPDVFYIVSPGSWGQATWMGMANRLPHSDLEVVSNDWIARHIQQSHGPLGAAYPDVAYGMEGDTPSFLGLIPNGLGDMEHPDWGGWGGRYELAIPNVVPEPWMAGLGLDQPETRPIWTNAIDRYAPPSTKPPPPGPPGPPAPRLPAFDVRDNYVTLWRWRTAYQNDFAARMDWTVRAYDDANHPPRVALAGPRQLTVRAGDSFDLDASGTTDPDGDSLSFFWFHYQEAGTYPGPIPFATPASNLAVMRAVKAPEVTTPQTAHFVLAVTDKGSPALTRYARVIVTIVPR